MLYAGPAAFARRAPTPKLTSKTVECRPTIVAPALNFRLESAGRPDASAQPLKRHPNCTYLSTKPPGTRRNCSIPNQAIAKRSWDACNFFPFRTLQPFDFEHLISMAATPNNAEATEGVKLRNDMKAMALFAQKVAERSSR